MRLTRNTSALEEREFDVLVIGAGIHGVCVARDAALRGLSVALIDQGDFGGETSHNSLKLIHSGIRYLQHLDIRRVRQSIAERNFWLRCVPHLVRPLKCVIPSYGYALRGLGGLGAASTIHNLLSIGSNAGMPAGIKVPTGGVMSKQQFLELLPALAPARLTGGVYWYDGQMLDADRILLEFVESAVIEGAVACNYVRAHSLLSNDGRVCGVVAEDALTGRQFEIRADQSVNASGPWAGTIFPGGDLGIAGTRLTKLSKCMNLVTHKLIDFEGAECAVGVVSNRLSDSLLDKSGRMFFVTPWKGMSIVGTSHLPYDGHPDDMVIGESDIDEFLDEINDAYPFKLDRSDVIYCYGGLTPAEEGDRRGQVARARHGEIIDHQMAHGIDGLVSVIGVKYTTARLIAEKVTDLIFNKLRKNSPACRTRTQILPAALSSDSLAAGSTGNNATGVSPLKDANSFAEQVREAVRNEMAVKLSDFVLRRSDLAETGRLDQVNLKRCAGIMAEELGWNDNRRQREIEEVETRVFLAKNSGSQGDSTPISESRTAAS